MADNALSQNDQNFAHAMKSKLRLNREHQNSQASEVSASVNEQSEQTVENSLSNLIIQVAMQDHPGLTEQTARKMLDEIGGQKLTSKHVLATNLQVCVCQLLQCRPLLPHSRTRLILPLLSVKYCSRMPVYIVLQMSWQLTPQKRANSSLRGAYQVKFYSSIYRKKLPGLKTAISDSLHQCCQNSAHVLNPHNQFCVSNKGHEQPK